MGFPGGSTVKNSPAVAGDAGGLDSPWVRKTPAEGNGNPLQYSYPENAKEAELRGLLSMGSHRAGHS